MKKALFLAAVTALLMVSARADQVNLKDGSTVKGKVVKIVDGKLTIKTESLGEMKIDFNNIANVTTDEPMVVSTTTSAATVTGKIGAAEGGKTAINGTVVANTDIKNVWRPGEPDPSIPPSRSPNPVNGSMKSHSTSLARLATPKRRPSAAPPRP